MLLTSVLDGFAAIAFAIVIIQGGLTLAGVALGDVLPDAHPAAITAADGLLVGVALRLLRIREIPVADLPPLLVVAPLLVEIARVAH